jgi:hypothetical protein
MASAKIRYAFAAQAGLIMPRDMRNATGASQQPTQRLSSVHDADHYEEHA